LADPIISLIYESGKFDVEATHQTAVALQFYAVGLAAYSGIKVLAPAFYAIDKRTTPMLVSFAAIGVNLVLNWLFTFKLGMGHRGLALSTGCVAIGNFLALYVLMRSATGSLETGKLLFGLGKLLLAGACLGGVCFWGGKWMAADWADLGKITRAGELCSVIALAGVTFFVVASILRVEEMEDLKGAVRRRLKRG
jgi:putative peptidoglycan lipid II flippase